jgi:D-glutamate cyclase
VETLIQQEVGRGATGLFAAARGGLWRAVSALAAAKPAYVGILTGFFVPRGTPPAAETDGPAGAALLALALSRIGVRCRLLTDEVCRGACEAALSGCGLTEVPVDAVRPDANLDLLIEAWRGHGIDWMIAIERCGLSTDGRPRNMRGEDIGGHCAKLDRVFTAGPWRTIAIGDGGNEIGMGALPAALIARDVPLGATIACVTPADYLIVAGVSHWGAYGLIAGLAVAMPDMRDTLLGCLDPAVDRRVLEVLVSKGPAVDGVTLRQALTIDGLELAVHRAKLEQVRMAAWPDDDNAPRIPPGQTPDADQGAPD